MVQSIRSFLKREDGPTAVEYAVILALVAAVVVVAIVGLGSGTSSVFSTTSTNVPTGP